MEKRLYMRGYHVDFSHKEVKVKTEKEKNPVQSHEEPPPPLTEVTMIPEIAETAPEQKTSPELIPVLKKTVDPLPVLNGHGSWSGSNITQEQTLRTSAGPRTTPTPDDLEIWGIVFIVLGIIIGLLSIPFWEAALTTAYILLGIGGAMFMAGLVCLFIYDPEGCVEACGEILVEALMGIILGILCGAH